jgi:hypothetical protein
MHVCNDVSPSGAEMNSIFSADMKNKLSLSIALAAALALGFLPNIYASGPESDSDDRSDNIPGGDVTNVTSTDCPENYYGGDKTGTYDLLDRWCDDL